MMPVAENETPPAIAVPTGTTPSSSASISNTSGLPSQLPAPSLSPATSGPRKRTPFSRSERTPLAVTGTSANVSVENVALPAVVRPFGTLTSMPS